MTLRTECHRLEVQGSEPQVTNLARTGMHLTVPWAPPRVATVIRLYLAVLQLGIMNELLTVIHCDY